MSTLPLARAEFVALDHERRGFYALPEGNGPFPGVLLYQEAFGVNDYVQEEVRRLARHGYAALAPDFFRGDTFDYGDFADKVMPKLRTLGEDVLLADIDASLAFLDAQREVAHGRYGAIGFCMGGRLAVLSAIARPQFAAAVSFYGGGVAPDSVRWAPPLLDRLPDVRCELLLVYGADDAGITPAEHARIADKLSAAKKKYALRVYPGAGHGFASTNRDSYRRDQAEEAWGEALALFARAL